MTKELIRFTVFVIIVGAIISTSVIVALVLYHHDKLMIDYIVSDDYSYVVYALDENKTFTSIKSLPDSIDEEFGGVLWNGCIENDKSKKANCYKYKYDGLEYLKIEIVDNKLIEFDTDNNDNEIFYYVENT